MLDFEQIKEILKDSWYRRYVKYYRNGFCDYCHKDIVTKLYYYEYVKNKYGITSMCDMCTTTHFGHNFGKPEFYNLIEVNEKELFTINILC